MAAPKYHPTPLFGGDRKALKKELANARAMTGILAARAAEKRAAGEALLREADDLACQSWNERMWADSGPIDPSPTIDRALNGGYAWLEIACARCKRPRSVDLAALPHATTTCIHDLHPRPRHPATLREVPKGRQAAGRHAGSIGQTQAIRPGRIP